MVTKPELAGITVGTALWVIFSYTVGLICKLARSIQASVCVTAGISAEKIHDGFKAMSQSKKELQ